jgi:hypothetical protein
MSRTTKTLLKTLYTTLPFALIARAAFHWPIRPGRMFRTLSMSGHSNAQLYVSDDLVLRC